MYKFLPAVFSFFFPGAGQIYNGQYKKGIIMMLLIFLPLWGLLNIYSAWDAWKNAGNEAPDLNFKKPNLPKVDFDFKKLVPLVVAVAAAVVIYLIILFAYFSLTSSRGTRGKEDKTAQEMQQIKSTLIEWKAAKGVFPQDLDVIVGGRPMRKDWLTDEWDIPYAYNRTDSTFTLVSNGKDKSSRTADDILVSY